MSEYRERLGDSLLSELLSRLPAVMLVGPRAAGKTTTAVRHAASIVRLDRTAEAVVSSADAALRGVAEPVLLDEWQAVPEVLDAVKRAVETDSRPGRYLPAGSVRADPTAATWPGTGRVVRVVMFPLTVAKGRPERMTLPLVDRIVAGEELHAVSDTADLRGYVDLALRGGFPEAVLDLTEHARTRWLEGHVDRLLTRDTLTIDGGRDPARLRHCLEAYVLNFAGLVDHKTICDAKPAAS